MNPVIARRLSQLGILAVFLGGTVYLLNVLAEQGVYGLATSLVVMLPLLWIMFAGTRWWVVMPIGVAFGGAFSLSFKFYTHEIALLLSLMALLPVLAIRAQKMIDRVKVTTALWVLLGLFLVNIARSLIASRWEGLGGGGSIVRVYLHGMWPVIFLAAFYHYGSTRPLKWVLILLYGTYLGRSLAGVSSYYFGYQVQVPFLNFVIGTGGAWDLRFTGIQLAMLAFACSQFIQSRWGKILHVCGIGLSLWLVLLGGGRASLGMLCVIPVAWAAIRRRFGWFSAASAGLFLLVMVLNQRPDIIYLFPEQAQRTLSILVAESSTSWLDSHTAVKLSNEWHQRLSSLGFERWSESVLTMVIGNRIEPYDAAYEAYSVTMEDKAQVAARQGIYESGLWTMLSPMGLCGVVLYSMLFYFLLKGPFLVLMKEGICGIPHVFYFWAVIELVLWIVFCWISGGSPSHELMMAGIAKAAYEDSRKTGKEGTPCAS